MSIVLKACQCLRRLRYGKEYNQVQNLSVSQVPAPADNDSCHISDKCSPVKPVETEQPPALRKESSEVYVFNKDKVRLVEEPALPVRSHEAPVFVSQDKVASVRKRLASL